MATESRIRSNMDIVREYNQGVFNDHEPRLASAYLAPDVTCHGGTLGTIEGVQSVTAMLSAFIGVLPDLHAAEQDAVAIEDTVAGRFVVEATHRGNLLGIAGRRVRWDAIDIYRLANGMIVEEWAADDSTAILHQVGAYTPPWLEGSQS